jgi:YihY family inner membrane protein
MTASQRFLRRAGPPFRLWLVQRLRILWRACVKYNETDGEQRAASFAYYAFFALFPLILLLITIGSSFLGNHEKTSAAIVGYVSQYIPLEAQDSQLLVHSVDGFIRSRKSAGLIAFAVLAWSALKFFQALVHGVNRAWGTKEYSWWRLPIQNLFMAAILGSALLLGSIIPTIIDYFEYFYWHYSWEVGLSFLFVKTLIRVLRLLVPPLVLFYGFAMFYKFAPRRKTTLREVWTAALVVTLFLGILQHGFLLYAHNIGHFNAFYGTFGSVVALLLWIYLSGSIIILGGCLAAAKYEIDMSLSDQSESNRPRE